MKKKDWILIRRRVSEIIEVGASDDIPSRIYDMIGTIMLLMNVSVTILYTFDRMELEYGPFLLLCEAVSVAFFAVDYCLRVWASHCGNGPAGPGKHCTPWRCGPESQ